MLDVKALLISPADLQRPLLHHINGDTSWLLQIPRQDRERAYFNILIDPWLVGTETNYTAWFHEQQHTVPSAFQTIPEVEDFLHEVESVARALRRPGDWGESPSSYEEADGCPSLIDAILISVDVGDHAHKETLLQVHPDVPVYGLKRSAKMISCWNHFRNVVVVPFFLSGSDWQAASVALSDRVSVTGLMQPREKTGLYYGFLITFDLQRDGSENSPAHSHGEDGGTGLRHKYTVDNANLPISREALVYIPHGIHTNNLEHLTTASPPLRYLVFLQGLHLINFGLPFGGWNFDSNFGAHETFKTQRMLQAKYWFATHDEAKIEKGFTSWFLRRQALTFEDALEHTLEKDELGGAPVGTDWAELSSGESRLLLP